MSNVTSLKDFKEKISKIKLTYQLYLKGLFSKDQLEDLWEMTLEKIEETISQKGDK